MSNQNCPNCPNYCYGSMPFYYSLFVILSGFAVIANFVFFIYHKYTVITFPYELTSGEGLILRDAVQIRNGYPLYTDPNQYPYIISIYPPVFPLFVAIASVFLEIGLGTVRFIVLFSVLLICANISLLLYRYTNKVFLSVIVGMFFTASVFVQQWSSFGRVDLLAILWSLTSIVIIAYKKERLGHR